MAWIDKVIDTFSGADVPPLPAPPGSAEVAALVQGVQSKLQDLLGSNPADEVKRLVETLKDGKLSPQALWDQLLALLRAIVQQFQIDVSAMAQAFDVQDSLKKIAEAINAAESTLRASQFSIVGGMAELDLKIKLVGDDGPAAKLNLQIAPRPHP
jgi:hypothetical protein